MRGSDAVLLERARDEPRLFRLGPTCAGDAAARGVLCREDLDGHRRAAEFDAQHGAAAELLIGAGVGGQVPRQFAQDLHEVLVPVIRSDIPLVRAEVQCGLIQGRGKATRG